MLTDKKPASLERSWIDKMNRMQAVTFLIFLHIFSAIASNTYCQSTTKTSDINQISSFKSKFTEQVNKFIKQSASFSRFRQKLHLTIVPVCYVDPARNNTGLNIQNITDYIRIDSFLSYAIIQSKSGQHLARIQGYSNLAYSFNEMNDTELQEWQMLSIAKQKYSDNLFAFAYSDNYAERVVAIFDKGVLRYLDRNMKLVASTSELIEQSIGSTEKYIEDLNHKKKQADLLNLVNTPEKARLFLRSDYCYYSFHFATDTSTVLTLLIQEIIRVASTNTKQNELIGAKIYDAAKKGTLLPYCGTGIRFFDHDITYQIKSVLTHQQYTLFAENRESAKWLEVQASNVLYKHLRANNHHFNSESVKNYVFGE